jgi:NAD-dependent deacetylase
MLPADQWDASVAAAEQADIFFTVGTSSVVYPAASLPLMAKRAGAFLVEINIEPTELSSFADEVLLGASGKILPHIGSMNS